MTSKRALGYTIVELMMALAVLAVGVTGVISMQRVTLLANQHAKSLLTATHIAQAWQEQLATDAISWNHPSARNPVPDLPGTTWLSQLANPPTWIRPTFDAAHDFGPAFDALGNVTNNPAQAVFCTHIRLSLMYSDTQPVAGNGLIRTEVRVFWLREGRAHIDAQPFCGGAGNIAPAVGESFDTYHFVYKTSAVRQNTAI
jgi:type II secretory pathway pseudopilin PulG